MANALTSPRDMPFSAPLADQAIEQMFGYYSRTTRPSSEAANSTRARVISELDAACAILAARRLG